MVTSHLSKNLSSRTFWYLWKITLLTILARIHSWYSWKITLLKIMVVNHHLLIQQVVPKTEAPKNMAVPMMAFVCFRQFLGHTYGKFTEIISLKAPGNYSAPFWSTRLSICSWENPKALISMLSGFLNVSPGPKTNYVYLWRRQDT